MAGSSKIAHLKPAFATVEANAFLLHRVAVVRAAVPAVGEVLESPSQKPLGRHRADLPVVEADVDHVRPLGLVVEAGDGQACLCHVADCLFAARIRENAVAFREGVVVAHVVFLDAPYDDVALALRVLRHAHEYLVLERRHERREQEHDRLIFLELDVFVARHINGSFGVSAALFPLGAVYQMRPGKTSGTTTTRKLQMRGRDALRRVRLCAGMYHAEARRARRRQSPPYPPPLWQGAFRAALRWRARLCPL